MDNLLFQGILITDLSSSGNDIYGMHAQKMIFEHPSTKSDTAMLQATLSYFPFKLHVLQLQSMVFFNTCNKQSALQALNYISRKPLVLHIDFL